MQPKPLGAPLMQRACWFLRGVGHRLCDGLTGKPTLLRRGFVMTHELMLFLALAGGFGVVLVEWWARQTP